MHPPWTCASHEKGNTANEVRNTRCLSVPMLTRVLLPSEMETSAVYWKPAGLKGTIIPPASQSWLVATAPELVAVVAETRILENNPVLPL